MSLFVLECAFHNRFLGAVRWHGLRKSVGSFQRRETRKPVHEVVVEIS